MLRMMLAEKTVQNKGSKPGKTYGNEIKQVFLNTSFVAGNETTPEDSSKVDSQVSTWTWEPGVTPS